MSTHAGTTSEVASAHQMENPGCFPMSGTLLLRVVRIWHAQNGALLSWGYWHIYWQPKGIAGSAQIRGVTNIGSYPLIRVITWVGQVHFHGHYDRRDTRRNCDRRDRAGAVKPVDDVQG